MKQRHRRMIRLTGSSMAIFLLTAIGCSGVQNPTVQVRSLQIVEQTRDGARLLLTLDVTNPNQAALPLVFSSYDVQVDGATGFGFADVCNRTLPAQGTQTVVLAAAVAGHEGRSLDAAAYRVNGWMSYEPPNQWRRLLTESGVPLPTVGFGKSGILGESSSPSNP